MTRRKKGWVKVKNASDHEQVTAAEKSDEKDEAIRKNDFEMVLRTREGRSVLWTLLKSCGVFRTVMAPDVAQMNFNEGMRNVGLNLLSYIVECSPDIYLTMIKEHMNEETFTE